MVRDTRRSVRRRRGPDELETYRGMQGLRGFARVLGGLVQGRTAVRMERERRMTLQLVLREAPFGTVVNDQSGDNGYLTVNLPQSARPSLYRVDASVLAAPLPALIHGASQNPDGTGQASPGTYPHPPFNKD